MPAAEEDDLEHGLSRCRRFTRSIGTNIAISDEEQEQQQRTEPQRSKWTSSAETSLLRKLRELTIGSETTGVPPLQSPVWEQISQSMGRSPLQCYLHVIHLHKTYPAARHILHSAPAGRSLSTMYTLDSILFFFFFFPSPPLSKEACVESLSHLVQGFCQAQ